MKIKSTIYTVLFSCLLLCNYEFPSYAYQIRANENGNFIRMGGINSYDGERAESYDETVLLETKLRNDGYILINTDFRDISDEEYNLFCSCGFWFSAYISDDEYCRVYVYKPSFSDFTEQYSEYGSTEDYTRMEINSSSVVISYGYWDSLEKAGTVSSEFNDNIPEGRETGYLLIISPVDAEIRLHFPITDRYFEFFVQADMPFPVRLKTGAYNIVYVNGYEFLDRESTVKNNNIIHIEETYTAENPYTVELNRLIETYGIPSAEISAEPDLHDEHNQDMPEYKVTIAEETENDRTAENNYVLPVITLIITAAMTIVWIYKRKKEYQL